MKTLHKFNRFINSLFFIKILIITIFMHQGITWAAVECHFGNGKSNTTTLTNASYSGGTVRIPPPGGGFYSIATFDVGLSPTVTAQCDLGQNGEDLWSITDTSVMAGTNYQNATFKTNIPGVVYTVYIHTNDGAYSSGGYFSDNTGDYKIIAHNDGAEDDWKNKQFIATVEVRVNDEFHGNPTKETNIHPVAGTLGSMRLGTFDSDDNNPWMFKVNEASFQIPVTLPTCDIMVLSNGSNTVDMGNYYISDIKKNSVQDVPFAINVSNCTSVAKFTTKMTSTKITGSANLLGNTLTSNAASGMGVKILYNGDQQLIPNNQNSMFIYNDNSIPGSTNINLLARLVADGNALKAGQFKATSTFTMTYD